MRCFSIYKNLFIIFCLWLFSTAGHAQTIYVKSDVAGGDGSSWASAFQYLDDAIASAQSGDQIWVAAGTYLPGGAAPSRDTFFSLKNGVDIYGGFAGNETMLSERNITANQTTLSGDLDGDDVDNEWLTPARFANAKNVIVVDTSVQDAIIDGFTISHGNTDTAATSLDRRGGGMIIFGAPTIRNCTFEQNYAFLGGGAYPRFQNASGTTFEDCIFQNNQALVGGGLYIFDCVDVVLNRCTIRNNVAESDGGGLYPSGCSFTLSECEISENTAARFGGGGRFDSSVFLIDNSEIKNNNAPTIAGGALFFNSNFDIRNSIIRKNTSNGDGGGFYATGSVFEMDQVTLDSNDSGAFGGGGTIFGSFFTIENSDISSNITGTGTGEGGGGLYVGADPGDTTIYTISNTTFSFNSAPFSSGIASYGQGYVLANIEACSFASNSADNGGGGFGGSFGSISFLTDCDFTNNTDVQLGGGLYFGGDVDGNVAVVENCRFANNGASTFGGAAVYVAQDGSYTFDSCSFTGNVTITGFGGAINYQPDSFPLNELIIDKCEFFNNNGFDQGGALNVGDGNVLITNSLFNFNRVTPDPMAGATQGRGGAISNNASFSDTSRITLVHNTFANNTGTFSGGFSQWEADSMTATALLVLQNNVFANDDLNYAVESGLPEVNSLGGNICKDNSMASFLTATNDASAVTDFGFVDEYNEEDFRLLDNSPLRDQGVSGPLVPATDIVGTVRDDGMPDIGAYEYLLISGTRPEIGQANLLQLMPNPADAFTHLSLDHAYQGEITVQLSNVLGQLIRTEQWDKNSPEDQFKLNTASLAPGIYEVILAFDHQLISKKMIKR